MNLQEHADKNYMEVARAIAASLTTIRHVIKMGKATGSTSRKCKGMDVAEMEYTYYEKVWKTLKRRVRY